MKVLAANVYLGCIYNPPADFNKNAADGAHLIPGETISWRTGGTSTLGYNDYVVDYKDGATLLGSYNINAGGGYPSGNLLTYAVLPLATVAPGDGRSLAYWEVTSVATNGLAGNGEAVTRITLTAHFADPSEEAAPAPHEHTLVWKETKEATEDAEGEICYLCECGYVEYRIPTSANAIFIKNTINKIVKAPYGSTVNVSTIRWSAFNSAVIEALAKRPDVSMNLTFRQFGYRGDRLKTTIPAGADLTSCLDENGYVGFNTLAANFGAVRVP